MLNYKIFEQKAMFVKAWELRHKYLAHIEVFDETYEKPKSDLLGTMHQQTPYHKVHALNIANSTIIFAERKQHP